MRKLFGIGVGPGDPELLTLKAYMILKEVDMIVAPRSNEKKGSLALLTIRKFIEERENKPMIVEPVFPMTKNERELEFYWEKAKKEVLERGGGCETIAFITLGDPSLYSTFYKFLDFFEEEVEEVEIIPGVTSFSACSALAKVPIAEGNEIVSIIPDVKENHTALRVIQNSDSVIFLKPKNTDAIKSMLGNKKAILGVKVGFEDQKMVVGNLTELKEPTHYLSTLIVKKEDIGTEPRDSKPRDSTRLTQEEEKWLYKDLTQGIIGAAMEVHRELGSGFLEYVYEEALCYNLNLREISFERQKELDICYKDLLIPRKYKPDLVVENKVIVEIKATAGLTEIEEVQLLNYLKATKMRIGLLLNFGKKSLEVKRRIL